MVREIWLHAGPPKSATTTVQQRLDALAEAKRTGPPRTWIRLSESGDPLNYAAALDLLSNCDWTASDPFTRSVLATYDPPSPRPWLSLVQDVTTSSAERVVVSAEHFAYVKTQDARRVIEDLKPATVHVVLVERPVGDLLISLHSELCKRSSMPRAEAWVRDAVRATLDEQPGALPWVSADWVAGQWRTAGADVHVVSAMDGLGDAVVDEVLDLLVPGGHAPATRPANTSLSATALELWQDQVDADPPRYVAAALATLSQWQAPGRGLRFPADRWSVTGDMADLLDEALAATPDPHAVHEVRQRLRDARPWLERLGTPPAPEDLPPLATALATTARRQNRRYRAADLALTISGRPRLARFQRVGLEP